MRCGGDKIWYIFFKNNQKLKQSPQKSIICYTISKQFAGANKRRKLNNPQRQQAKTVFLHRKPKRNAHFGLISSKVYIIYSRCPCNKLWRRLEYLNILTIEVNRPSTKQLLNSFFLEKLKQFSRRESKMHCL